MRPLFEIFSFFLDSFIYLCVRCFGYALDYFPGALSLKRCVASSSRPQMASSFPQTLAVTSRRRTVLVLTTSFVPSAGAYSSPTSCPSPKATCCMENCNLCGVTPLRTCRAQGLRVQSKRNSIIYSQRHLPHQQQRQQQRS